MMDTFSVKKEQKGVNFQGMSFFEYLFVIMLILYAGMGNIFFTSNSFINNTIGVSMPIIFSVILVLKWNIVINKQFYLLILCVFTYSVAISIKYGELRPTIFLSYFFLFFVVYAAIKALKINLFIIYERILYYLAIIALFMWGIQILLGGDTLFNYFSLIPSIDLISNVSSGGINIIFYSVQTTAYALLYGIMIPRNCGYAWEPGGFAVYLSLAIFINLFIIRSNSNSKKRFWVFVLALLSTQSTTGYVIFMVIIFYYFLNKNLNILILVSPIVMVLLITLFSLPFMSNKIVDVFNQTREGNILIENSIMTGSSYAPGRFLSFTIAFKDFLNNPVLGLGTVSEESWTHKIGASISTISGIGNLLAQFGIIGFLFFIILSLKSSFFFAKYFNYNGKYMLFFLILLISVSYSVILLPIVMSFWMYSLFETHNISQKVRIN